MAAADKTAADTPAAPSKRGMLIPIIAAVVVSGGVAAGAVYFLTAKKAAPAATEEGGKGGEHESASEEKGKGEGHGESKSESKSEGKGEEKGEGGKKGGATYFPMTPAFVVNLSDADSSRFLQIDMEVLAKNVEVTDAVKLHMPQIRNSVLMLLSQQKFHDIDTREGKEALQAKVLAEIQRILTAETGKPGVDAVYFTSFVMQ